MRRGLDPVGRPGGDQSGILRRLTATPQRDSSPKLAGQAHGRVLLPARETAEHYARLFVQLKRASTPIPDNDLWISALVLEHDLVLITRDRHFEQVPQMLRR